MQRMRTNPHHRFQFDRGIIHNGNYQNLRRQKSINLHPLINHNRRLHRAQTRQNGRIQSSSQKLERTIKISRNPVEIWDSFSMHWTQIEKRQARVQTAPYSLTKKSHLGVHCFDRQTGENFHNSVVYSVSKSTFGYDHASAKRLKPGSGSPQHHDVWDQI